MSGHRFRLTIPRFFGLVVGALAVLVGLVLTLAVNTAGQAVVRTSEATRMARASQVAAAVERDLEVAERAVDDFEQALSAGAVDDRDPSSLRHYLTAELIALRNLTELTLTAATIQGYDSEGNALLAPDGRGQTSLYRERAGAIGYRAANRVPAGGAGDPTLHDTFKAAASQGARGQALWSDLAYTEFDAALPVERRRKTMTVQKAIFAPVADSLGKSRLVGVLRAGIISDALDRVGVPPADGDPHRLFICDADGRLITRLGSRDPYAVVDRDGRPDPDGDLRVTPPVIPPPVAAALAFARDVGAGGKRMSAGGTPFLLTLVPLAEGRAQQWLVGIVVPESHYVGTLARARDRLLGLMVVVVLGIAVVAFMGARTVGRGMRTLVQSTEAMRRFSFEPTVAKAASTPSRFAEIAGALESVERAKTALRAMVKYVPIDLVRRLYESGRDPVLGAEITEVTLMFTDIENFTTHAESMSPRGLAEALGRYLETATRAVEATGGTVDKYIGDALMVLWNVPAPVADHPAAACEAALACATAGRALGMSPWWRAAGLPPWHTRFGLHTDEVLVGNFGAPERLSYTAMGDGVNLAARLEGLNKVYGTTILASEAVRRRAGDGFVFRRIDRVAVKGKAAAVSVHELVGRAGEAAVEAARPSLARYELALDAVHDRRFDHALALLAQLPALAGDGPAAVLAERCRRWLIDPPPADWDGTWTATSK